MKWDKLKAYIEETLEYSKSITAATDQERGFMNGFEDVIDKIRNLENEEVVNNSNRYWIPEEDENNAHSNVTIGKEYKIVWDSRDEEEVIIDDDGTMSLVYMIHNGRYRDDIHKVVEKRSGKVWYTGTLDQCKGFMWDLYMDDSSDDGLYVWCDIE